MGNENVESYLDFHLMVRALGGSSFV
jgi:hypothetical protein